MIILQYLSDQSSLFVRVYDLALSYTETESNNFNIINISKTSYSANSPIDKRLSVEIIKEKTYTLPVSS